MKGKATICMLEGGGILIVPLGSGEIRWADGDPVSVDAGEYVERLEFKAARIREIVSGMKGPIR